MLGKACEYHKELLYNYKASKEVYAQNVGAIHAFLLPEKCHEMAWMLTADARQGASLQRWNVSYPP
jgi:hypothetical protein